MATQDYADQLTAIYLQLTQINGVLANLATLSSVSTIQASLNATMSTIYSNINSLNQTVCALDLTVSAILCNLRST